MENREITVKAEVEDIVILRRKKFKAATTCGTGVMYVRNGNFYYKSGCDKCCGCDSFSKKYGLSNILKVLVIGDETIPLSWDKNYPSMTVPLGLVITMKNDEKIVAVVNDASKFGSKLREACGLSA